MQLLAQPGKFEGKGLQLFRLLRNDTGKRALVLNHLVFGPEPLTVRYQANGFGAGNAGLIHSLGNQVLAFNRLRAQAVLEQLGQGAAILPGIGEGLATLPALDIVFEVDLLIFTHKEYSL